MLLSKDMTLAERPIESNLKMKKSLKELRHTVIATSLRSCQLFAGLPTADLHQITDITFVKALEKDDYLFHQGETSSGFYIVQKGAINVHRVNSQGKEQVIHIFRAGESFAEATLAIDTGYPGDARCLEPSQVLLVQKLGFLELLRKHPELGLRMLASMSLHLRDLVGQLEDFASKDVETRLANWLIRRCPNPESREPCTIELTMAKRVLAAELGTVSETFSRTLAKFREQKLLTVNRKAITIRCPARLLALLRANLGE